MTSKEIIKSTLEFRHSGRIGRQLWLLPWAVEHNGEYVEKIKKEFPDDIVCIPCSLKERPKLGKGDPYAVGDSTDDFGCKFHNIQKGVVGEVKEFLVNDEEWEDMDTVHIPTEWLTFDIREVNENCIKYGKDKFTMAGMCPRPFERLQFIRGTENLYIDLMTRPKNLMLFMEKLHSFYCELIEKWAQSDVDSIQFMDDWGAQRSLLINPVTWRELFKPLYRDYCSIAKKHGKKVFMHSDGYILDIIPDLIEIGVDAVNSQVFCMGIENLQKFKGKITFWGEIDRQHILRTGSLEDVRKAVADVMSLYQNGGVIAQFEFGAGAKGENAYEVFKEFAKYDK